MQAMAKVGVGVEGTHTAEEEEEEEVEEEATPIKVVAAVVVVAAVEVGIPTGVVSVTATTEFKSFEVLLFFMYSVNTLRLSPIFIYGGMRSAPSSLMHSPLSIWFSTMCCASWAYSSGLPKREGKGT